MANEMDLECPRCGNDIRFMIYYAETTMYNLKFNSEGRTIPLSKDPDNSSRDMIVCIRCPFCGFRAPPNFFGFSEAGLEVRIVIDARERPARESRLRFRGIPFASIRVYFEHSEQAEAARKLEALDKLIDLAQLPVYLTDRLPEVRKAAERKYKILVQAFRPRRVIPKGDFEGVIDD